MRIHLQTLERLCTVRMRECVFADVCALNTAIYNYLAMYNISQSIQ